MPIFAYLYIFPFTVSLILLASVIILVYADIGDGNYERGTYGGESIERGKGSSA